MVDLGDYPAVLDDAVSEIVGEVWEVDQASLARLDELEGYPRLYTRRVVELRSGNNAWMYILRGAPQDHGMSGTDVPDGDYRGWLLLGGIS